MDRTLRSILVAAGLLVLGLLTWKLSSSPDYHLSKTSEVSDDTNSRREVMRDQGKPQAPGSLVHDTPASEKPAPPRNFDRDLDLAGQVITSAKTPVAGARVTLFFARTSGRSELERGGSQLQVEGETRSDENGYFAFRLRPGTTRTLRIQAEGFGTLQSKDRLAGEFVLVELRRGTGLTGRVLSAVDDSPVAGARVFVRHWNPREEGIIAETTSLADGSYSLTGILAERVYLEANHPEYLDLLGLGMDLSGDHDLVQDLYLERGLKISGRVLDVRTKTPIVGAAIATNWTMDDAVLSDAEGRFESAPVSPTQPFPRLHVEAEGYSRQTTTTVIDSSGQPCAEFLLSPGHTVKGRVVGPDGTPLKGAHAAAFAYNVTAGSSEWRTATADTSGEFKIESLSSSSRHTMLLRAEGYGDRLYDLPADELNAAEYDAGQIRLAAGGTIKGKVVTAEGQPVARGFLSIRGGNSDRHWMTATDGPATPSFLPYGRERRTRTDDLGRFTFTDLAGGEYDFDTGRVGFAAEGDVRVSLGDGETKDNIRLTLVDPKTTGYLRGIVVDEENQPISFPTVSCEFLADDGPGPSGYNHFGADGRFSFDGLQSGRYRLSVDRLFAGRQKGTPHYLENTVEPVSTGRDDLRIELKRAVAITGNVGDRQEKPFPWSQIYAEDHDTGERFLACTDIQGRFTVYVRPGRLYDITAFRALTGDFSGAPPSVQLVGILSPAADLWLELPR